MIWQELDYMHMNPVRAKIVAEPSAYIYSSAQNYLTENMGCLLEIDLIEALQPSSGFKYFPEDN